MFKTLINIIACLVFVFSFQILSSEPFVVLSYNNSNEFEGRDNAFTTDPDFFTKHTIASGESLNLIIEDYYSGSGLNKYFLQLAIVSLNEHAFRNRNINYMVADETIHLPSINQITDLMKGMELDIDKQPFSRTKNIYFFGG
jgi:hypothetical protein